MRHLCILLLAILAGCASQVGESASAPATEPTHSGQLIVTVDASGGVHIGGMAGLRVASQDWPEVVKQWHVTAAVVCGDNGTKVSDMLKVQSELRDAGVNDVTIEQPGGGR